MARLNPGHKYGRFLSLVERAGFPKDVHTYLRVGLGMTSMEEFVGPGTLKFIEHGAAVGYIDYATKCEALSHWNAARKAHGVNTRRTRSVEEEKYDMDNVNSIDAGRNEMVALLQASKGAKFVEMKTMGKTRATLMYKFVPQHVGELDVGDVVIGQVRGGISAIFAVGRVSKVMDDPPTSNEYDYNIVLRHIVGKVDVEKSMALEELDRQMLRAITASEATDRLERLMRQLGITADNITLDLPDASKAGVIE